MINEKQILLSGSDVEPLMRDAGFVNVTTDRIKIEIGDWGPGAHSYRRH